MSVWNCMQLIAIGLETVTAAILWNMPRLPNPTGIAIGFMIAWVPLSVAYFLRTP